MSKRLNSDLMVESFYSCISKQPQYPDYVIIEYRSTESTKNTDDPLFDTASTEIVLHSAKDIPKILENKIIGFSFAGELIRPIMKKPNDNKKAAYTTKAENVPASESKK